MASIQSTPVGTGAAGAVEDAGQHAQTKIVAHRCVARFRGLEVVDRSQGRERRVRPAVPQDEFSASLPEFAQVGIRRVGDDLPSVEHVRKNSPALLEAIRSTKEHFSEQSR